MQGGRALRVLCALLAVLCALPFCAAAFGYWLVGRDVFFGWWPALFPTGALLAVLIACAGPDRWVRALPRACWAVIVGASAVAIEGLFAFASRPRWGDVLSVEVGIFLVYWALWSPALPAVAAALLRRQRLRELSVPTDGAQSG